LWSHFPSRPEYSWKIARWTLNTNQSINQSIFELKLEIYSISGLGIELWCLMPLSKIFSVILWQSVLLVEKTTDPSQVADKLYHIKLYRVHNFIFSFNIYRILGVQSSHIVLLLYYMVVKMKNNWWKQKFYTVINQWDVLVVYKSINQMYW